MFANFGELVLGRTSPLISNCIKLYPIVDIDCPGCLGYGIIQAGEDLKTVAAVQAELKARKAALDKFDVDGKGAEEKLQKDHQLLSKVVAQATTVLAATDRFKDGVAALQQVSSPALLLC